MSARPHSGLLATAILLAAAAGCCPATTTVLLVRHAEKGLGSDPDLTPEGRQRAQALVAIGRQAGVVAAFHTQYKRSAQTAQPLAADLGIPMIQVDYTPGQEAAHAEALVRAVLAAYAGKVVLVVGHTTTLPVIMEKLGVRSLPAMPETQYGDLFVIIRTGTEGTLVPGRFGP